MLNLTQCIGLELDTAPLSATTVQENRHRSPQHGSVKQIGNFETGQSETLGCGTRDMNQCQVNTSGRELITREGRESKTRAHGVITALVTLGIMPHAEKGYLGNVYCRYLDSCAFRSVSLSIALMLEGNEIIVGSQLNRCGM